MEKIMSDLYRYTKKSSVAVFIKEILLNPRFKYSFYMRICNKLDSCKALKSTVLPIVKLILRRCSSKYGVQIPYKTIIGEGLYIIHWGGIVVNRKCQIGKNLTISHGVTLGQTNRGEKKGAPVIGDNVYIGAGAKVIGRVRIGNNCAIGANAVVTKDIPDNGVAVGIPAKVISFEGSDGYIHNMYQKLK